MPSEVYEIKKLRWKEFLPNSFWAKKPDGNSIKVYLSVDGNWWATNTDNKYRSKQAALTAAEKVYRQQLRKALRRVRPSTQRPRHKKKGE